MMRSEAAIRTFVTFRVAGDNLVPDDVSRLLQTRPSAAHAKGDRYTTGISTITAKTGVWLFSTDHVQSSTNLLDHLSMVFSVLGLNNSPIEQRDLAPTGRMLRLKQLLEENSLTATMTIFWHASHNVPFPTIPDAIRELFQLIPISIETDFDRDEEPVTTRRKVA